MNNQLPLDELRFKKAALVLRALKHLLRQKILHLIYKRKTITVREIYTKLKLKQSVASQQLAVLRKAKFVTTRREGKHIYYALDYVRLEEVQNLTRELLKI
jgi:DNA-binding transcriptional ArsR family regulator